MSRKCKMHECFMWIFFYISLNALFVCEFETLCFPEIHRVELDYTYINNYCNRDTVYLAFSVKFNAWKHSKFCI